jgi:hypothetical protein
MAVGEVVELGQGARELLLQAAHTLKSTVNNSSFFTCLRLVQDRTVPLSASGQNTRCKRTHAAYTCEED